MHACMALVTPPSAPPSTCPDPAAHWTRLPYVFHSPATRILLDLQSMDLSPTYVPHLMTLQLPLGHHLSSHHWHDHFGNGHHSALAISVEWALAELIKNPRVQHKAQEELDRIIDLFFSVPVILQVKQPVHFHLFFRLFHFHLFHCKWKNRLKHKVQCVITEADFTTLPYLQCEAKQSLRLHPQLLHNPGRSGPDRAGDEFQFSSGYSFPCSVETGWWRRACLWVQIEETRYGDEVPSRWSRSIVI
jgi:hypothetical protein